MATALNVLPIRDRPQTPRDSTPVRINGMEIRRETLPPLGGVVSAPPELRTPATQLGGVVSTSSELRAPSGSVITPASPEFDLNIFRSSPPTPAPRDPNAQLIDLSSPPTTPRIVTPPIPLSIPPLPDILKSNPSSQLLQLATYSLPPPPKQPLIESVPPAPQMITPAPQIQQPPQQLRAPTPVMSPVQHSRAYVSPIPTPRQEYVSSDHTQQYTQQQAPYSGSEYTQQYTQQQTPYSGYDYYDYSQWQQNYYNQYPDYYSQQTYYSQYPYYSQNYYIPQPIPTPVLGIDGKPIPDYSALHPYQKTQKIVEFRINWGTLRSNYPHIGIPPLPENDREIDLTEVHIKYDRYMQMVWASDQAQIQQYWLILIASWGLTEFLLDYWFGIKITGYTKFQFATRMRYEKMLIQLGQRPYMSFGQGWSVEALLVWESLKMAAIFYAIKFVGDKLKLGDVVQTIAAGFVNQMPAGGGAPAPTTQNGIPVPPPQSAAAPTGMAGILGQVGPMLLGALGSGGGGGLGGLGDILKMFGGGNSDAKKSDDPNPPPVHKPSLRE